MNKLLQKSVKLEEKYKEHFGKPLPNNLVWWWDPLHADDIEMLAEGVQQMETDINNAIRTNKEIKGTKMDIIY